MLFLERSQQAHVLSKPSFVDRRHSGSGVAVYSYRERDVTAGDSLPQQLAQLTFPAAEGGWNLQARAEEPVVDGANLDTDTSAAGDPVGRAETRHATYHVKWANLRRDNSIGQSQKSHRTP